MSSLRRRTSSAGVVILLRLRRLDAPYRCWSLLQLLEEVNEALAA